MPKRYSGIYNAAITMDSLYAAFLTARKGKRTCPAVYIFERRLPVELRQLHNELTNNIYKPKPYKEFIIYEPKERSIMAPAFRDVVVQHAFYALIYPIFDQSFIYDNYGCRIGKGNHAAADRAHKFLRSCDPEEYFLQLDIRKFYYNINRDILRKLLEKKIKETKTIELLMDFANTNKPLGVPIGNLLSQLYAQIYLNPLDHFIKRELKIKKYVRYVDDFLLFGYSKEECHELKSKIEIFLKTELNLELSKFIIAKTKRGINFVGFRAWHKTRIVRKHSLSNFTKALKKRKPESLVSIIGNAKHSSSYKKLVEKLILYSNENNWYPKLLKSYFL